MNKILGINKALENRMPGVSVGRKNERPPQDDSKGRSVEKKPGWFMDHKLIMSAVLGASVLVGSTHPAQAAPQPTSDACNILQDLGTAPSASNPAQAQALDVIRDLCNQQATNGASNLGGSKSSSAQTSVSSAAGAPVSGVSREAILQDTPDQFLDSIPPNGIWEKGQAPADRMFALNQAWEKIHAEAISDLTVDPTTLAPGSITKLSTHLTTFQDALEESGVAFPSSDQSQGASVRTVNQAEKSVRDSFEILNSAVDAIHEQANILLSSGSIDYGGSDEAGITDNADHALAYLTAEANLIRDNGNTNVTTTNRDVSAPPQGVYTAPPAKPAGISLPDVSLQDAYHAIDVMSAAKRALTQ